METKHDVFLTDDQLRRRLSRLGLKRRGKDVDSPLQEVEEAIEKERGESGRDIGYRVLHQRLTQKHKLKVGRDTVMMLSAIHDPVGAQERRKHKLKRREYHSKVCIVCIFIINVHYTHTS
ncbi:uncharacterized protein [Dysidea avara]|uniref:uncharacterized protein n=1 Tax=Dysidea avara TaxID=196820 RepID=UPI003328C94D